jgi:hypothetical protein
LRLGVLARDSFNQVEWGRAQEVVFDGCVA